MTTDTFKKAIVGPVLQPTEILDPVQSEFDSPFWRNDFKIPMDTIIDGDRVVYTPKGAVGIILRMKAP